jgi:flagellar L-ring protein precursor FlgH
MKRLGGMLILAAAMGLLSEASADSIWQRRDPRAAYLFQDSRARRVGDILQIVIQDTTGVKNNDLRKMDRSSSASGVFNFKGDSSGGKMSRTGAVDFNASGTATRDFSGAAAVTINRQFTDRISVAVIDVQPNGNLIVEGTKRITVDREQRLIRISGIVRPTDLLLDNSVLSQQVANFQITYIGKGPEYRFANQNYVGRLMNWLWPF